VSDNTAIEWTDATWNPVTGCTEVSPGCDHCYAKTFAERWRGTPGHYFEHGFDIRERPAKLREPLRWKTPRRIFVNSMSDLFHDSVSDQYIALVWSVMQRAPQHTFQVLTKRHARMRSLLNSVDFQQQVWRSLGVGGHSPLYAHYRQWPLPNVWMGVSAENQQWAEIRIPALHDTPAAIRFVSAEPLLSGIEFGPLLARDEFDRGIDWVIVGGESGHGARPMHPRWAEQIHRQCEAANVPFLFKQWGEWTPMAPLRDGKFDFRNGHAMTSDGNLYGPGDLTYPDGPRYGEAIRADFPHRHPTSMYRVGKGRAGRELYHDGRTFDDYPEAVAVP
jgi:protein gp37